MIVPGEGGLLDADRLLRFAEAQSFAAKLGALASLYESEHRYLAQRQSDLTEETRLLRAEIAALDAKIAAKQAVVDRILRQTYVASNRSPIEMLLGGASVIDGLMQILGFGALTEDAWKELGGYRSLREERVAQNERLRRDQEELASLGETLRAKEAAVSAMVIRVQQLGAVSANATAFSAEAGVLRGFLDDAVKNNAALDELIARSLGSAPAGAAAGAWVWPAAGIVSQGFGPTALALEPPRTVGGVRFPHFHDAIDIAAPLGTPVFAAAAGRVTFAGHLPDGAMVVVIAHAADLVSLYAHLDDTYLRPTVRVGEDVVAGQRIGTVGLTGITTGPHLHFSVHRAEQPVDPRSLLAARSSPRDARDSAVWLERNLREASEDSTPRMRPSPER